MANNRYLKEEDDIIIKCVSENVDNLSQGFRQAEGLLINRTYAGIVFRWYHTLSKTNITFTIVSSKKHSINRKVSLTNSFNTTSLPKWKKIMNSLFKWHHG